MPLSRRRGPIGAAQVPSASLAHACHHRVYYDGRRYYWDKGALVTDTAVIRRKYLRGWFVIDFVSVLPFDHLIRLLASSGDKENLARTTRFMRFTRIMRFARLVKLAKLTQLQDAMETVQAFLTNIGISAMDLEFGEGQLQRHAFLCEPMMSAHANGMLTVRAAVVVMPAVLRQVGLVCVLLGVCHLVGCMWLHIGRAGMMKLDADGNPAPEGWMTGVE